MNIESNGKSRLRRGLSRSAECGFSLVELLVVLCIISILVVVLLGPITRGIQISRHSYGMQNSRTLAIAEFQYASDHNQCLPDRVGGNAANVARLLLAGNYVNDPGLFWLPGSKETKYTGASASTDIDETSISWDFAGRNGNGVPASAPSTPDTLPLVWSSLGSTDAPSLGYSGAITVRLESSMPLGTDGMVVTNHGNSSRFVLGAPYTYNSITYSYAQLCDPSYPGFAGVTVLSGGG